MKASGRNDAALVEFTGKVQRIVQVHQFGLKEQPNPHCQSVQYPARQLLGFSWEDKILIDDLLIRNLS